MSACTIYRPREDSSLLEKHVRKHAAGAVLDVGTGSGIQAIAAAEIKKVGSVLAVDIQKGVIDYCRKCIKNRKIAFMQSDLFAKVRGKFDTIIFNPPYLPEDIKVSDITIEGGKKGYEAIERFLNNANKFLNPDGIMLMVFSSLSNKAKVDEFIRNNMMEHEELERARIFFEDLHVYRIKKSEILKELEKKRIKKIAYFAKGHRGIVFKGVLAGKEVIIKCKNPKSMAENKIQNEAKWIKILNKHKIGPKLLLWSRNFIVYKYVNGDFVYDFIKKSNKSKIKKIIKDVFKQMLVLDKLKICKEEMHHPYKHVIVSGDKPVLIDFERAHNSKKPKNATQFCQFLINSRMSGILEEKFIKISRERVIALAKDYKNSQTTASFSNILKEILQ